MPAIARYEHHLGPGTSALSSEGLPRALRRSDRPFSASMPAMQARSDDHCRNPATFLRCANDWNRLIVISGPHIAVTHPLSLLKPSWNCARLLASSSFDEPLPAIAAVFRPVKFPGASCGTAENRNIGGFPNLSYTGQRLKTHRLTHRGPV